MAVQKLGCRPDHFRPDTHQGMLPPGAQPQMAMVHQELNAVLLWRNGVGIRQAHDLQIAHGQLVTPGRAGILAHRPADELSGWLRESAERTLTFWSSM